MDYKQSIDASPSIPEESPKVPSWDNGTLYAAAMEVMRQEYEHNLKSIDIRLPLENRRAHKFVSINLTDAAMNVLKLTGDRHANIQLAVIEMRSILAKDWAAKNKNVVSLNET